MAKGQKSKIVIQNKILELFPEAFIYGKEIRIPIEEDGEIIQIKITLTAAKASVEPGSDNEMPSVKNVNNINSNFDNIEDNPQEVVKVSDEEKANLATLMKSLGL